MKSLIAFQVILALVSAFAEDNNKLNIETKVEERVVGGQNAPRGRLPYQVGLYLVSSRNPCCATCGGTLISSKWVISAAHCDRGYDYASVRLGAVKFDQPEFSFTVRKSEFIRHEGYQSSAFHHDLLLIPIPNVAFSDTINKVNLPKRGLLYTGVTAVISGFGKTSDSSGVSPVLKYGLMKVIDNSICSNYYKTISKDEICIASDDGTNICDGDSGGPLVTIDSPTLIGVTAYGKSSCENSIPVVFTRVTEYLDWIQDKTGIDTGRDNDTVTEEGFEISTEKIIVISSDNKSEIVNVTLNINIKLN